jgi:thiamine biosynthesis protein ThiS
MMPSDMGVPTLKARQDRAPDATPQGTAGGAIGLVINGEPRTVRAGATIADVLSALELDPRTVIVEHNREILRDRRGYGARRVDSGDVLEVVHFVGGG